MPIGYKFNPEQEGAYDPSNRFGGLGGFRAPMPGLPSTTFQGSPFQGNYGGWAPGYGGQQIPGQYNPLSGAQIFGGASPTSNPTLSSYTPPRALNYQNSPFATQGLPQDVVNSIKGAKSLTQNPGIIPDSPFVTNFALAQRGGPGVDLMNAGLAGQNASLGGVGGIMGMLPQYQRQTGNVLGQQQGLANYLAGQATGTGGPSAAQGQFQQNLDQNLASAMALGQSQAGVSPGAALRNILEQQGRTTGQAASQAAQLRAQEQQAAQQQLGGVLGGMGQLGLNAGQQALGFGQLGLGIGQQQFGQSQLGANLSQEDIQNLLNLENQRANVFSHQQSVNASENPMNIIAGGVGGLLGGIGSLGQLFGGKGGSGGGGEINVGGLSGVDYTAHGAEIKAKNKFQKAVKSGDDEANDKIPAMLSEGEIVLPRSVAQHPDAEKKAAEFVAAIKKHKKMARGGLVGNPAAKLIRMGVWK